MPREQDSREREEKRGNLSKEILATAISLVGMFAGTILAAIEQAQGTSRKKGADAQKDEIKRAQSLDLSAGMSITPSKTKVHRRLRLQPEIRLLLLLLLHTNHTFVHACIAYSAACIRSGGQLSAGHKEEARQRKMGRKNHKTDKGELPTAT